MGVLSRGRQCGGGSGRAGSEVVYQFLEGGLGGSQDHLSLSEEMVPPLQGNGAIWVRGVVGHRIAMVDVGFKVVGEGIDGSPLHLPALKDTVICSSLGPVSCEGSDVVLGPIN